MAHKHKYRKVEKKDVFDKLAAILRGFVSPHLLEQYHDDGLTSVSVRIAHHPWPEVGLVAKEVCLQSYVSQFRGNLSGPTECVRFSSGRVIPTSEIAAGAKLEVGLPLAGFTKDDGVIADIGVYSPRDPDPVECVRFLIRIGHMMPFRGVSLGFVLGGVSRKAALHLLRYAHIATNLRSQKYLNQEQFAFVYPSELTLLDATDDSLRYYALCMREIQKMYEKLRDDFGWDAEDARLVIPNATEQQMYYATSIEQWRHLFDVWCDEDYVGEVHALGCLLLAHAQAMIPGAFDDYKWEEDDRGLVFAKRNRCQGCNVKVNWLLSDEDKREFGVHTDQ